MKGKKEIRKMMALIMKKNTKIALFPCACHSSASSAVNTTCPTAAPGDAGKPVATTLFLYLDGSSN